MRLIDADELKKCVLRWLPQDPCGKEEKEMPFETDICVSMLMEIDEQPTIQPEIIYCKDCVKHNKGLGNYEAHPDGSSTWIWKDSACPLVSWRDKAQGHEFDYQFCAYAEKREVTP